MTGQAKAQAWEIDQDRLNGSARDWLTTTQALSLDGPVTSSGLKGKSFLDSSSTLGLSLPRWSADCCRSAANTAKSTSQKANTFQGRTATENRRSAALRS